MKESVEHVEQGHGGAPGGNPEEPGRSIVTIKVNGEPASIHRGHQPVAEIKRLGGVPPADVLAEVIDGKLVDLADGAGVTLKGGEEFFSHPRDSGSSKD